jgi:hemoglobin
MDVGNQEATSLYRRLGGYNVIAAVVNDLFSLVRADARFGRFGTGRSDESKRRAQQLTVAQICSLSGGPCYYIGRDMKTSHAGLGITDAEWDANLELTKQALRKNGIGGNEELEFLELFERHRHDIVESSDRKSYSSEETQT